MPARLTRALGLLVVLCTAAAGAAHAQSESPTFAVRGFAIEGELPVSQADAQAALAPYPGEKVGLEALRAAARALEELLTERGYAFHRVVLPPQTVEETVRLQVLPFRLANVQVSGNQHFSAAEVLRSLPALKKGESPNVAAVARDRAHANEHPARQAEVRFRQSAAPDSVDADVKVQDTPPLRAYAALQNTGDERTGEWRATLGVQHSNLFELDHQLSASYTLSPGHGTDVKQYGLFYTVPFYGTGGSLTAFGAHSDVDSGTIADAFEVSGRGRFAGLRWKQHLTPAGPYSHSLEGGVEDRFYDNSVVFGGTQLGVDVRSRPLVLGYAARYDFVPGAVRGSIEHARNLGGGEHNTDAAYSANRAGADRRWQAWRFAFDVQWIPGAWTFGARLRAQYADQPLIPGEQFGIGGAASVRGLREREASGERGHLFGVEAGRVLPWPELRAVLFYDSGSVHAIDGEAENASSAGAGLRWTVAQRASLLVDLAQVLDGAGATAAGHRRAHVSLALQF